MRIYFQSAIQTAVFYTDASTERIAVVLADNTIGVAICSQQDNWELDIVPEVPSFAQMPLLRYWSYQIEKRDIATVQPIILENATVKGLYGISHLLWFNEVTLVAFGRGTVNRDQQMSRVTLKISKKGESWFCCWHDPIPLTVPLLRPVGVNGIERIMSFALYLIF